MTDYQELMAKQGRMAGWRDMDAEFWPHYEAVRKETMLSVERLFHLYKVARYIAHADIPGDIVECGVWRGGAMALVARVLLAERAARYIHLYDTFAGHPKPGAEHNNSLFGGVGAQEWREGWAASPREVAERNMLDAGQSYDNFMLYVGQVEHADVATHTLALAHIDIDWYEAIVAILPRLWDCLSPGGVLIVDDYGHYDGQKKAVDEFFADKPVLLHRIDYSCRSIQKVR